MSVDYKRNESGAVSLFLVIFSALFITTVAVSFVRIMILNQAQATTSDLSKSALDSANAGVEDAKRAIVIYRNHCVGEGDAVGTSECNELLAALNSQKCDTIQKAGIAGSPDDKEVMVKQSEGDTVLNQAYTCVKVQLDTDDFVGELSENTSHVVPLKSDIPFDTVTLEWFSQSDFQEDSSKPKSDKGISIDVGNDVSGGLPKLANWPLNKPALMRVQLIQYGNEFNLSSFNNNDGQDSNNSSVFLYPIGVETATIDMGLSRRDKSSDLLQPAGCVKTFTSISADRQYACKAVLKIPKPIGVTNLEDRHAYLRVTPMYNQKTSFRVSMQSETNSQVHFSAVQPAIDSTGRANDLFRRVRSRVELDGSSIPAAESAVDISGSLCKTFLITDNPDDYVAGTCSY
jgi:hypothetical protein